MAACLQVKVCWHTRCRLILWPIRLYARSVCDTAAAVCGLWRYISVVCLCLLWHHLYWWMMTWWCVICLVTASAKLLFCVHRWWCVVARTTSPTIFLPFIETWQACHPQTPVFSTSATCRSRRWHTTCISTGYGGGNTTQCRGMTGWPFVQRVSKCTR